MRIVTIKTDPKIIEVWKREVGKACPDATVEVIDEPKSVNDVLKKLESFKDDVLYTLPVHVLHDCSFLSMLKGKSFIGFKPVGSPSMTMSFFAATNEALNKILEYGQTYVFDNKVNVDVNMSNLILNALGQDAMILLDDNSIINVLAPECKGRGSVATLCGSPEIIRLTAEAQLNTYDVVSQIMDTVSQEKKQVEYRDK